MLLYVGNKCIIHASPIHATFEVLTKVNEEAACSSKPTSPCSVKYFPEQMPSSSGDKMSSETADSSSTLEDMFLETEINY